jgi:hypothetical protein
MVVPDVNLGRENVRTAAAGARPKDALLAGAILLAAVPMAGNPPPSIGG